MTDFVFVLFLLVIKKIRNLLVFERWRMYKYVVEFFWGFYGLLYFKMLRLLRIFISAF